MTTEDRSATLAAWLAGELDAAEATALEAELARDPELAAAADAMADALVALGGVDDVAVPQGFSDRLHTRLDAALERPLFGAEVDDALTLPPPAATSRPGSARPGAGRPPRDPSARSRRLARLTAVAAALAVVAGGTAVLLRGAGQTGSADREEAAFDTAQLSDEARALATAADDSAAATEEATATEEAAEFTEQAAVPAPAAGAADLLAGTEPAEAERPAPVGPEITAATAQLADEAAVRARYTDREAVRALLGRDLDEAAALAADYREALHNAGMFGSGVPVDVCADAVADVGSEAVIAVVESIELAGEPAIAYVLVRAQGTTLDTVEVFVTAPADCAVRLFLDVSPE